jgi:hypothetical protein
MVVVGNPQGIESRFLGQPGLPDEFLRAVLLGRKEVSVTHHAHPASSSAPASKLPGDRLVGTTPTHGV